MKRWLLLLLLIFPLAGLAQTQEPLTKNSMSQMMDWVGIFTMYTDVELTDKIDLNEYADAATLAASMITNYELSIKIFETYEATDVNIYPRGILQSDKWMFKKLNEVSQAQYDVLNAPYVTLEVLFIPVTNGYKVAITILGSTQITHNLQPVNTAMNNLINGTVFAKPRDAKEKVNKALFEGFDRLKTLFGDTYVSNIAVVHDGARYLNGHTIQVWQRAGESITLTAFDRNDRMITGNVIWTNAIGNTAEAHIPIDVVGIREVTVKSGSNQISVNVQVKEFEANLEEVIERLVKEILQMLIEENETQRQEAERSQLEHERTLSDKSGKIYLLREQQSGTPGSQEAVTHRASIQEGFYEEEPGSHLLDHPDYGEYIRKYQARDLLLKTLIKLIDQREVIIELLKPESISFIITQIRQDIDQITSSLILNLIRSNEQELKNFLTEYLKSKIIDLASNN